ncbi:MAG: hypothetical protein AAFU03_17030, partial [Bacteroidota bacterium]
MEVFRPITTDLITGMTISFLLIVVFAIVGYRLGSRKNTDPRQRIVLPMLFYFASLLAFISLAGNLLAWRKYPVLEIGADKMVLNGKIYPLARAGDIRIETVNNQLRGTTQILLLQTPEKKTFALP